MANYKQHAKTSRSFDKYHAASSSSMSSLVDRTARFLSEEIAEDVPTGITPRKKAWNVPTDWQRTEPREALIAAMRRTATASPETVLVSSESGSTNSPNDEQVHSVAKPPRSLSQQSLSDDSENQISAPISVLVAPSINGLSSLKPPTGKMDLGKGRKDVGAGRVVVPILGEGGANIPRRVRK